MFTFCVGLLTKPLLACTALPAFPLACSLRASAVANSGQGNKRPGDHVDRTGADLQHVVIYVPTSAAVKRAIFGNMKDSFGFFE